MSNMFGQKGLSWDLVDQRFWVITQDKFGMLYAHVKVPKYSAVANGWTSEGQKSLGLAPTHPDDNPVNMYEIRPGLTAPAGFPQVVRPQYNGATHELPELVVPKPQVADPAVVPGTIPGHHMTATFSKRNDNTDPTIRPTPAVEVKQTITPVIEEPKAAPEKVAKPVNPLMSSPECVYKSLLYISRALGEMKKDEPNWQAIDHYVDELQGLLSDVKWPINEWEG